MFQRCEPYVLLAIALLPRCLGAVELPIDRGIGRSVADFTLKDTSGKQVSLRGIVGKKGVVVVFIGTGCPVNDLYLPRLAEFARRYEKGGLTFVAVASNHGEAANQLAEHVKRHGFNFPILMDPGNAVADVLLAERTCEVVVLDSHCVIRYRGAIDDQYTPTARKNKPAKTYLVDALDALLGGGEVKIKATPVAGCPIERREPPLKTANGPKVRATTPNHAAGQDVNSNSVAVGRVTYAADVASIMQHKCQGCHRPGQVGPLSLLTYEQTRNRTNVIREVVEARRMPPWHADPRYGRFRNDRSLSARERAVILAWVDQGAPEGDLKNAPTPRVFGGEWSIGTPDVVIKMPEPYTVAAQGVLPYENFRVPTGFKEDTWVQSAEALPGDRSVVHHIVVKVDDPKGRMPQDPYLAIYVPGDAPSVYPEGTAKLIPANSDLIFQMHYTPVGRAKLDRSSVGLILAKGPVKRRIISTAIANGNFAIPAGHGNYPVEASHLLAEDSQILSFFPHMHLRGKSFRYTATYPDGKSEVLLSVPAYDFGWQSVYQYAETKRLPRGTRIDCLAHYDNSARNPNNPDATKTVQPGEQTFEEMMIGFLDLVVDLSDSKAAGHEKKADAAKPLGIPNAN